MNVDLLPAYAKRFSRFQLERFLAKRPHGQTMLALDRETGAQVIFKLALANSPAGESLKKEIQLLKYLDQGMTPRWIDNGTFEDQVYLAREYAKGNSLATLLERGRFSIDASIEIGVQLLTFLERLHSASIIHRDLKPDNIIVMDGKISVIDLGLACHGVEYPDDTSTAICGSVKYMSPEQSGALRRPVGPCADLFSVGAILYECLTGQQLYQGTTVGEVLRQHVEYPIPEIIRQITDMPTAIKQLLTQLLQKDPRLRYTSATAALVDCEEIAARMASGEEEFELTKRQTRFVIADPSFIGRKSELAALHSALESARQGRGGVVFLESESGGGKTRLLEEFRPREAWLMRGQGLDKSADRPFQIFSSIIESVVQRAGCDRAFRDMIRETLAPYAQAIVEAFPQTRALFELQFLQIIGPESLAEQRTLKALSELLNTLGEAENPAVIILDDVQWADELSVKLLIYWASAPVLHKRSTLIIASFRSEEVSVEHPLRNIRTINRIALPPLNAQDINDLIVSMTGDLPEEASRFVLDLSQGNAFMACAIIQGLYENGTLRPSENGWIVDSESLREAQSSRRAAVFLAQRLQKFPPKVLRCLRIASVLGKEFDISLLQSLAAVPLVEIVDSLEEARSRRVIWTTGRGQIFSFTHDKIRETLLNGILPTERKRLHFSAALAIEKEDCSRCFELAYHFSEAGDLDRAFPYALQAGQQARSRCALRLAETYLRIANQGLANASTSDHIAAGEGLGDVYMLLGKYDLARTQFESIRKLSDDPLMRSQLDSKIGEVYFKQGDVRASALALENGVRALNMRIPGSRIGFIVAALVEVYIQFLHTIFGVRKRGRPALAELLAIRLHSRLAYTYWFGSGLFACAWAHLREMNMAERFDETLELAQAYSEHAPVSTLLPWFSRGVDYVKRSLEIRRRLGDLWGEGQSLHFYGVVLYSSARFAEAIEKCNSAFSIFERSGDRWEANTARWHIAYANYRLGRLKEAYEISRATCEAGLLIGDHQAVGISLSCWAKATGGRVPRAMIQAELQQMAGDAHTRVEVLTAEALRLLRQQQHDESILRLKEAIAIVRKKGLRQEYVIPPFVWLVTAMRQKIESLPLEDVDERRLFLRLALKRSRRALRHARFYRNNLPHVLRERGYLLAYTGRLKRAIKSLEHSIFVSRQIDARYEEALSMEVLGMLKKDHQLRSRASVMIREMEQPLADVLAEGGDATLASPSLRDRFSTLLVVGRQIASALDRETVFDAVRSGVRQLLRVRSCWLIEDLENLTTSELPVQISRELIESALSKGEPVSIEELLGQNPSDSLILLETSSAIAAPIFVDGRAVACIYAVQKGLTSLFGREEKQLAGFITAIAGAALQNAGRVSEIQDLSDERSKLFQRAQKALDMRDQFLSLASHELKTPITTLQLQSDIIKRVEQEPSSPAMQRFWPVFKRQLVRLEHLVNDLLDVSRLGAGRFILNSSPEIIDVGHLVHEVVSEQKPEMESEACEVEIQTGTQVCVKGDRIRLGQVVSNLLTNAYKYAAGKIIVTIRSDEESAIVEVRDFGPGVDEKYREMIFERFEQAPQSRSVGGLGLGLYISREIVRFHGGELHLDPEVKPGACFRFSIPKLT